MYKRSNSPVEPQSDEFEPLDETEQDQWVAQARSDSPLEPTKRRKHAQGAQGEIDDAQEDQVQSTPIHSGGWSIYDAFIA